MAPKSTGKSGTGKSSPGKGGSGKATAQEAGAGADHWSREVTEHSDALDLEPHVFEWKSPTRVARSLLSSAERSRRKKSAPFRSAMSMLTFFINRAGARLPGERRAVLEAAKNELRRLYNRPLVPTVRTRHPASRR